MALPTQPRPDERRTPLAPADDAGAAGQPTADAERAGDLAPFTPSEDDRRTAAALLAAIFVAAGIAHLTHRRYYRSLLPMWLQDAREELDVVTGALEVFGGVLLAVPRLRKLARWVNLAVLAPSLVAGVSELRHPMLLRPYTLHQPGLNPVGPLVLAPGHLGLAASVWWVTADRRYGSRRPSTVRPPGGRSDGRPA